MYIYIYIIYIYIYVYVYININMNIYIYVCVCVCMYIGWTKVCTNRFQVFTVFVRIRKDVIVCIHHPFSAKFYNSCRQKPSSSNIFCKPWEWLERRTDFSNRRVCSLHFWFKKEIIWYCQIRCVYKKIYIKTKLLI